MKSLSHHGNADLAGRHTRALTRESFSARTVPLLILFGILMATWGAFSFLNGFIQRFTAQDYQGLLLDTQTNISQNFSQLEQTLRGITALTTVTSAMRPEIQPLIRENLLPGATKFDRLFLLRRDIYGRWQSFDLQPIAPNIVIPTIATAGNETVLAEQLSAHLRRDNSQIVINDLPMLPDYGSDAGVIQERMFILAQPLSSDKQGSSFIVGLTRVSDVLNEEWFKARPDIAQIVIRDKNSDMRLFSLTHASSQSAIRPSAGHPFVFPFANTQWQIITGIMPDAKMQFMTNIPNIILLLGLLLSAVAALYVRTNQTQAKRLTAANRALGHKNLALNNEVAERERLNKDLLMAKQEYKAIINAVSDIIFELSTEGEFLFLNDTWEKISHFPVEQILHRRLFDLLPAQDQEEQRRNFELLVKGQKPAYRALTRIRTASGIFRAVELTISIMQPSADKSVRVVGTMIDIEERRRAESALREAEQKYRTIVDNAASGIYQITPEGQVLSANPAMARILSYNTVDEMLRKVRNAHELYENRNARTRYIQELQLYGMAKSGEAQVRTSKGELIWINENTRAVKDDDGDLLYFEGSIEDITKRKNAELKLQEAKVQSDLASRAKSEFLANMSHELRTPLNAIIGFSEIIKNEVLGPLENRQYWEYARDIHDSGWKLLNIINEILDISRIEAGERQLTEGLVDVSALVKSCVDFVGPKAQAGCLKIMNNVSGSAPRLIGEELAVKQIIINLLSNAIKFTPVGGGVTISYELDRDHQLRLSITDTGIGLSHEEIEKALSLFGQVDVALSRANSGSGLGLTLVNALMQLHGGRLELFSQKGIGTTATLVFPARRVAQAIPVS